MQSHFNCQFACCASVARAGNIPTSMASAFHWAGFELTKIETNMHSIRNGQTIELTVQPASQQQPPSAAVQVSAPWHPLSWEMSAHVFR
eukprot:1192362-Prorocentrum_minimum.AAC.2